LEVDGVRQMAAAPVDLEAFNRLWMMGVSAERSLGRPREWDGKDGGFDDFTYKFSSWLGGLPGNVEDILAHAQTLKTSIVFGTLDDSQQVMAKAVSQALRALVSGKALNIVKQCERGNGFECWRRLWSEYRPDVAGRKLSMLESIMEDKPAAGEDFGTWYYGWTERIRGTEQARGKPIDDDIKCAVILRRAPKELRDHLVLEASAIADNWEAMNAKITNWMTARKVFTPVMDTKTNKKQQHGCWSVRQRFR
jgi:hypothetical protein